MPFVDLEMLEPGMPVFPLLARELDIDARDDREAEERVLEHLHRRRSLLVFDSCEHALGPAINALERILRTARDVTILATSREPLALPAETCLFLAPLAIPPDGLALFAADAQRFSALVLFEERARAVDPAFTLDDATIAGVTRIVRLADGIPLALELAAAQVSTAPLEVLADELAAPVTLPRDESDGAARQPLGAVIDWGFTRLPYEQQILLRRLAVFAGGWTAEAARIVAGAQPLDPGDVAAMLEELVRASFVLEDPRTPGRYTLFESTHRFLDAQLDRSDDRRFVLDRHAAYFREFVEACELRALREPLGRVLAALTPELRNIEAATRWTIDGSGVALDGALMLASAVPLTGVGRDVPSTEMWLSKALARVAGDPVATGRLKFASALTQARKGQYNAALPDAETAIAAFARAGDRPRLARAYSCLASVLLPLGRVTDAIEYAKQGLELADTPEMAAIRAVMLALLEGYASVAGDEASAERYLALALDALRDVGDELNLAALRGNEAVFRLSQGRLDDARSAAAEAYERAARVGDARVLAWVAMNCGSIGVAAADYDGARTMLQRALTLNLDVGDLHALVSTFFECALLAAALDQCATAIRLIAFAETLQGDHFQLAGDAQRAVDACKQRLLSQGGAALWEGERATGASLSLDDATELALSI